MHALKSSPAKYVDIRPYIKQQDQLSPLILTMPLQSLLRSKALLTSKLVIFDGPKRTKEKQQICNQLLSAGYQHVVFVQESAKDLLWQSGRLVHRSLPDHGWREVDAQQAHQLLADTQYVPVIFGDNSEAVGWLKSVNSVADANALLNYMKDRKGRPVLVIPAEAQSPHSLPVEYRSDDALWVADGLDGIQRYQAELTLSMLQRNRRTRICGR